MNRIAMTPPKKIKNKKMTESCFNINFEFTVFKISGDKKLGKISDA